MKRCHTNLHHFSRIASALILGLLITAESPASDFPTAAWHRGDVSSYQENSRSALIAALNSTVPNIEVDIIDFTREDGTRVGLLTHDYTTDRITGKKGDFRAHHNVSELGENQANPDLPPEAFMIVLELFDLIKRQKDGGKTPRVSLDMKEEGAGGEAFGRWVGQLIRSYGFEAHVFASSFYADNVKGVKAACPECMVGGLVFNDHWALRHLNPRYTSLDLSPLSKATFFLGYLGKKKFPHDFVLIQDDVLFQHPELATYWRDVRKVKFVGVFTYEKEMPYTDREWEILESADWLEIDPVQMHQYINRNENNRKGATP